MNQDIFNKYTMFIDKKDIDKNFKSNIKKFAFNIFIHKKTGELSSGQKNRVSLAKAFINDPEILLLDEPTASLDPDIGDYVRGIIENFSSSKQKTILIASHNMNEVERLSSSVLMMKNGVIIDQDSPKELIKKLIVFNPKKRMNVRMSREEKKGKQKLKVKV